MQKPNRDTKIWDRRGYPDLVRTVTWTAQESPGLVRVTRRSSVSCSETHDDGWIVSDGRPSHDMSRVQRMLDYLAYRCSASDPWCPVTAYAMAGKGISMLGFEHYLAFHWMTSSFIITCISSVCPCVSPSVILIFYGRGLRRGRF